MGARTGYVLAKARCPYCGRRISLVTTTGRLRRHRTAYRPTARVMPAWCLGSHSRMHRKIVA